MSLTNIIQTAAMRQLLSNTTHDDDPHHEELEDELDHVPAFILLVVALFCGVVCQTLFKRNPLPYTVLLLLVGMMFGGFDALYMEETDSRDLYIRSGFHASVRQWQNISPHLVLNAFLPVLIFESAFNCNWHIFKVELAQIVTLAVPGVILRTVLTAVTLLYLPFDINNWNACLMLGAMLSTTDPVAVVALMKELGTSQRLSVLIEGESLLNDGTSIVIFTVFLDQLTGAADRDFGDIVLYFFQLAFGGAAIGYVSGVFVTWFLGRIYNDATAEISLTLVAAYATFLISEGCKTSGVLALVVMGLVLSSEGKLRIEPQVQHVMHEFWELAGHFANTIIFFMSGVIVVSRGVANNEEHSAAEYGRVLMLYIILHLIRGSMLTIFFPILQRTGYGMTPAQGVALGYGGLRGAVGLALALIIHEEHELSQKLRSKAVFYMCGIAFLTLVINGTTMGLVLKAVGLSTVSEESEKAFEDKTLDLENDVVEELQATLKEYRFLSDVSMGQVLRYLPVRSKVAYIRRTHQVIDESIPPRLRGRWERYDEVYGERRHDLMTAHLLSAASPLRPTFSTRSAASSSATERGVQLGSMDASMDVEALHINRQQLPDIAVLKDFRFRFARSLRIQIWVLIDDGFLEGQRGGVLIELADTLINDEQSHSLPLQTFEIMKDIIERSIVGGVTSSTFGWLLNTPARKVFKRYVHHELAAVFELSNAFVAAHEKARDALMSEHSQYESLEIIIQQEVLRNVTRMEEFCAEYTERYTEIMEAVKVKVAARVMLALEREKISHLQHLGVLDEREIAMLMDTNSSSQTKLPYHPISSQVPSKHKNVRFLPFFKDLSDDALDEIASAAIERLYKPGDVILHEGDRSDFWMVVVRGTARCVHDLPTEEANEHHQETLLAQLTPFDEVGLLGVLSNTPRQCSVKSNGFVVVYSWDVHTTHHLMQKYPAIDAALWKEQVRFVMNTFIEETKVLSTEDKHELLESGAIFRATPSDSRANPISPLIKKNFAHWSIVIHGKATSLEPLRATESPKLFSRKSGTFTPTHSTYCLIEPGDYEITADLIALELPTYDPFMALAGGLQQRASARLNPALQKELVKITRALHKQGSDSTLDTWNDS